MPGMASAVLTQILQAVAARVRALGLTVPSGPLQGQALPVVVLKAAKREEGLDQPWTVCVAKAQRPEVVRWIAFKSASNPTGTVKVSTTIDITLLSPNDGNQEEDPFLELYRQQVRTAFQAPPLAGVPLCYDLDAEPEDYLPVASLQDLYDEQTVGVRVTTAEPGGAT